MHFVLYPFGKRVSFGNGILIDKLRVLALNRRHIPFFYLCNIHDRQLTANSFFLELMNVTKSSVI